MDHRKSKGIPEKTSTSASLTMLKPLTMWITTKWKILKEMGIPVVMYGCESWAIKKAEHRRIDALNCGVGEDS